MKIKVKTAEFDLHEEDRWYAATIEDIQEEDGTYGDQFKFVLELDVDDADRRQFAWCSQKLTPKSKLYGWLKGILGRAPSVDEEFDLADLVGKRVGVMFERYEGGDGLERDKVVKIIDVERAFPDGTPTPPGGDDDEDLPF